MDTRLVSRSARQLMFPSVDVGMWRDISIISTFDCEVTKVLLIGTGLGEGVATAPA
jgi:hypothetical protein